MLDHAKDEEIYQEDVRYAQEQAAKNSIKDISKLKNIFLQTCMVMVKNNQENMLPPEAKLIWDKEIKEGCEAFNLVAMGKSLTEKQQGQVALYLSLQKGP